MDGVSFVVFLMLIGLLVWLICGLGWLINEFIKVFVVIGCINYIFEEKIEYE